MSEDKLSGSGKSAREKFEADFDAFLRDENSHLAALYRKLPQPEPDARIDAQIQAQARRALGDPSASAMPARRGPNWMPLFGTAAVLVVVAGLASRMAPQVWPSRTVTESSATAPTSGPTANVNPAVPASSPAAAPVADAQVADHVMKRRDPAPVSTPPLGTRHSAQPTSADPGQPDSAAAPAAGSSLGGLRRAADTTDALKSAPASAVAPAPLPHAAPEAFRASNASPSPSPASKASDSPLRESVASPPPPASMAPPAPPPPPIEDTNTLAAPAAASVAADTTVPSRLDDRATRNQALQAELKQGRSEETPEHWIARIRVLLHQRQHDAALRNLQDFRRRYPDYELPPDLRRVK